MTKEELQRYHQKGAELSNVNKQLAIEAEIAAISRDDQDSAEWWKTIEKWWTENEVFHLSFKHS